MRPLTLDDLLPLDEFAYKRREYFESHLRYLDRYRRVRLGPLASVVFENRQTLWFRVQDLLRIARVSDPRATQRELNLVNHLLPAAGQLQAALLIDVKEDVPLSEQLKPWAQLDNEHIHLFLGRRRYGASLTTCRPEDRCIGASHWITFQLDESAGRLLDDFDQPARLGITLPYYQHESAPLSEEIRHSLRDDLQMTEMP